MNMLLPALLLAAALGSQAALAGPPPAARKPYEMGVAALRAQDFQTALHHFQRARDAGSDSHALHYNMGVGLYRLGRYQEARQSFQLAARDAGHQDLAHFNLGLTALQLGESGQAQTWFRRVALESGDERLRDLAQQRLDGMQETKPPAAVARRWSLLADASLGYDDNVTLVNADLAQGSDRSDRYLDLYASAKWRLAGSREDGYWLNAKAGLIEYARLDAYDDMQAEAGVYRDLPVGAWQGRGGASVVRSHLGGNPYQQLWDASVQASRTLASGSRMRMGYTLSVIDSLDGRYDYLAGTRHRFGIDHLWKFGDHRLRLDYDVEFNDREDLRSATGFTSYSATRHGMGVSGELRLAPRWSAHLGADYRASNYNDANVSGGVKGAAREDVRYRLTGELARHLNERIELTAGWRHTSNHSNIASRDYRRAQYVLGVRGYF